MYVPWSLLQAIDSFVQGPAWNGWPLEWFALAIVGVAILEAISRFGSRFTITGTESPLLKRASVLSHASRVTSFPPSETI